MKSKSVYFCVLSRNLCLLQGHKYIFLFFSRGFLALLCFKNMIHLELSFVEDVRKRYGSLFFPYKLSNHSIPLVENTFFPPLNYIKAFIKNQLTIYTWVYFWTLFYFIDLFVCTYPNIILPLH